MRNIFLCFSLFISLIVYSQPGKERYIASELAITKYASISKQSFYIFPEARDYPLKWNDSLHAKWIENDYSKRNFVLRAQPGEYFVFQVGIWAIKNDLKDVKLLFSDLKSHNGKTIASSKLSCFNAGGVDYLGRSFTKKMEVEKGKLQALWIGLDLTGILKGTYNGIVTVSANNETKAIKIELEVDGEQVQDHGFNEGSRLSRMFWLNSTLGINDKVTKGYLPVTRDGHTLHILGRSVTIADNGLPAAINSYFNASNQSIAQNSEPILTEAFRFVIEKENGDTIRLTPGKLQFTENAAGYMSWQVKNSAPECELICSGRLEFDGFINYKLALNTLKSVNIRDIRLEVPVNKSKADYMMGLGREGGIRPASWQWQWDTTKNQDALWLGAVNGGIRLKLKAENYRLPLVNIYYKFAPLHLPPSWGNHSKGGVNIHEKDNAVWINAYSGSREMKKGNVFNYDFELLITPFRTISNEVKYGDRYYHGGGVSAFSKIDKAKKVGANIINIHQAEDIYPFINYPYLDENINDLKAVVQEAQEEKQRLKLYYTTRELTKNIPEFQPFYSLNGEVLFPGPGNASRTEALHPQGPNEWLIKNLREKYIPAWYNPIKEGKFKGSVDLSVITTPNSRLNNFYIGGLDWMLRNLNIDGVYIDDAALDRFTLRRARKLIDQYRPEGRMDLHSWNHFNSWAGFANCLNLYMDLLPYFDLVWIGEGRDYDRLPDHWLIEVSGIPFGLPGQMLEGGGNPWRGMVYGITNRAGWTGNNPAEVWKFWDGHNIKEKELIGYWDKNCAVTTNNEYIKASLFKGNKESIIAIANWSREEEVCSVIIDWNAIGYDPSKCSIIIPYVKDFQEEQTLQSLSSVNIAGKKGYMIVIKENE